MDGCVWPFVVGRIVFGGLLDDELEFGAVLHLNEDAFVGVADACVLEGLADGYLVEDGVLKSVEPGQQIPEASWMISSLTVFTSSQDGLALAPAGRR